jgi:hypothetical protein
MRRVLGLPRLGLPRLGLPRLFGLLRLLRRGGRIGRPFVPARSCGRRLRGR